MGIIASSKSKRLQIARDTNLEASRIEKLVRALQRIREWRRENHPFLCSGSHDRLSRVGARLLMAAKTKMGKKNAGGPRRLRKSRKVRPRSRGCGRGNKNMVLLLRM